MRPSEIILVRRKKTNFQSFPGIQTKDPSTLILPQIELQQSRRHLNI